MYIIVFYSESKITVVNAVYYIGCPKNYFKHKSAFIDLKKMIV